MPQTHKLTIFIDSDGVVLPSGNRAPVLVCCEGLNTLGHEAVLHVLETCDIKTDIQLPVRYIPKLRSTESFCCRSGRADVPPSSPLSPGFDCYRKLLRVQLHTTTYRSDNSCSAPRHRCRWCLCPSRTCDTGRTTRHRSELASS